MGAPVGAQPRIVCCPDGQTIVHRSRIYRRAPGQEAFVLDREVPPIPSLSEGMDRAPFWDGHYVYRSELENGTRSIHSAYLIHTPDGRRWFWGSSAPLPQGATALAALMNQVLVSVPFKGRSPGDPGGLALLVLDLVSGRSSEIARQSGVAGGSSPEVDVEACVKDGKVFLFWTTGQILSWSLGEAFVRTVVEDFWPDFVPNGQRVERVQFPGGKFSPLQPPKFTGPPFPDPQGVIHVPLQVREKVIWDRKAMEAQWKELPDDFKEAQYRAGTWPPKEDTFAGSSYVMEVLRIDTETRKVSRLPSSDLKGIATPAQFTGEMIPGTRAFLPLAMDGEGRIGLLDGFIQETKPEATGKSRTPRMPAGPTGPASSLPKSHPPAPGFPAPRTAKEKSPER